MIVSNQMCMGRKKESSQCQKETSAKISRVPQKYRNQKKEKKHEYWSFVFKGIVPQFILFFKYHILDGNRVWYCWFWWKGSINPINLTTLVKKFVPRDLNWQRSCAAIRGPVLRYHSRSLCQVYIGFIDPSSKKEQNPIAIQNNRFER